MTRILSQYVLSGRKMKGIRKSMTISSPQSFSPFTTSQDRVEKNLNNVSPFGRPKLLLLETENGMEQWELAQEVSQGGQCMSSLKASLLTI